MSEGSVILSKVRCNQCTFCICSACLDLECPKRYDPDAVEMPETKDTDQHRTRAYHHRCTFFLRPVKHFQGTLDRIDRAQQRLGNIKSRLEKAQMDALYRDLTPTKKRVRERAEQRLKQLELQFLSVNHKS
jgi:hypothetical protein